MNKATSMGSDINRALLYLKDNGIEAFELDNILVIPCTTPDEIYEFANRARKLFKECGYEKSWRIDPYYYQKRDSLSDIMYNASQKIHDSL